MGRAGRRSTESHWVSEWFHALCHIVSVCWWCKVGWCELPSEGDVGNFQVLTWNASSGLGHGGSG